MHFYGVYFFFSFFVRYFNFFEQCLTSMLSKIYFVSTDPVFFQRGSGSKGRIQDSGSLYLASYDFNLCSNIFSLLYSYDLYLFIFIFHNFYFSIFSGKTMNASYCYMASIACAIYYSVRHKTRTSSPY